MSYFSFAYFLFNTLTDIHEDHDKKPVITFLLFMYRDIYLYVN